MEPRPSYVKELEVAQICELIVAKLVHDRVKPVCSVVFVYLGYGLLSTIFNFHYFRPRHCAQNIYIVLGVGSVEVDCMSTEIVPAAVEGPRKERLVFSWDDLHV
jgi:hypothetical protein